MNESVTVDSRDDRAPDVGAQLTISRFGYYELADKPTRDDLRDYYQTKYYQEQRGHYQGEYSPDEMRYLRNKLDEKRFVVQDVLGLTPKTFLDVGAGEGWALAYFAEAALDVTGVDFSDHGCATHHPDLVHRLIVGDIVDSVAALRDEGALFDLLLVDNVLEHLVEPAGFLRLCRDILADNGCLIIEVPNDFSPVQTHARRNGHIDRDFWIAVPDHLSYFNRQGLIDLCASEGWASRYVIADHPIDLNLLNPATNYVAEPSLGRACHRVRIEVDNLLHNISLAKTVEYYRAMADLGLGRQIIGFFQPC